MESLLRWGIANTAPHDPNAPAPAPRTDLDPAIIDHILGKPDAQLMREALAVAEDASRAAEERVAALDEFEMLVEQIDNASNIENLQMWQPLHALLSAPDSPDALRRQTLWVIGTAVQNNPSAQHSYLALHPLPTLLSFLEPTTPAPTRCKAVYALSGVLKHSSAGVAQLTDAHGWDVLRAALEDSDIGVRRKTAFLLNTLLVPNALPHASASPSGNTAAGAALHTDPPPAAAPVHANTHASMLADPSSTDTATATLGALRTHGLLGALISALAAPTPWGADGEQEGDADFEEKVVGLLSTYVSACGGAFAADEKARLAAYFAGAQGEAARAGWGLAADEMRALRGALA